MIGRVEHLNQAPDVQPLLRELVEAIRHLADEKQRSEALVLAEGLITEVERGEQRNSTGVRLMLGRLRDFAPLVSVVDTLARWFGLT